MCLCFLSCLTFYWNRYFTRYVHMQFYLLGLYESVLNFQNRPVYVLPFFCYQVFDFSVAFLSILGVAAYTPWLKQQLLNTVCWTQNLKHIYLKYTDYKPFVLFYMTLMWFEPTKSTFMEEGTGHITVVMNINHLLKFSFTWYWSLLWSVISF